MSENQNDECEEVIEPGPRKMRLVGERNDQHLVPSTKVTDKEEQEYLLPFYDIPLHIGSLVLENGQWKRIHKKKVISFQSHGFEFHQVTSCNEFLTELCKPIRWVHEDNQLLSKEISAIFVTNHKETRDTKQEKETNASPYKLVDSFPEPGGETRFQLDVPHIYRTRIVKVYKRVDGSDYVNNEEFRDLPISLKHSHFTHDFYLHESYQIVDLFVIFDNREVSLNKKHRIKSNKLTHQKEIVRVIDDNAAHKSIVYEKTYIDTSRAYDFESGREYIGEEQAREVVHVLVSSTPIAVGRPTLLWQFSRDYKQDVVIMEEYERPQRGGFPALRHKHEGATLCLDLKLSHFGFRDYPENSQVFQIVNASFTYEGKVHQVDKIEISSHPFQYQYEALVGDNGKYGWFDNGMSHVSTKYEKVYINTESAIDFSQRIYVVEERRKTTEMHVKVGSESYWVFWTKMRYRIPHNGEEYICDD